MSDNKSLPLKLLINAGIESEEQLLKGNSFHRLCVIGKSDNGRVEPYGLYKSIAEVARDYGVEASEYKVAVNHFNQFEDGEVLIISADYDSIIRPKKIQPPIEVEPEPEPEEDFNRDYITMGYEPVEVEFVEPDVPDEPEPEPEKPEPIDCLSNEIAFDVADTSTLSLYGDISIWSVIEIQGVDYKVGFSSIGARKFIQMVDDNGARYTSNQLISSLIAELVKRNPDKLGFILQHTNYALSSFDFGKELSGIDGINKDSFTEQVESIGGRVDNFVKDPAVIRFKRLNGRELDRISTGGVRAVNLLDLYNKGKEVVLNSCLAFKYTPPVEEIDTICKAGGADMYHFNRNYIVGGSYGNKLRVVAVIEVDGIEKRVYLAPFSTAFLNNMVNADGVSHVANEMLAGIIMNAIGDDTALSQIFHESTNYAIASYDYSRELSGIDSENKEQFETAVSIAGGNVKNFKNKRRTIRFKGIKSYELSMMSLGDTKAVNLIDLFNDGKDIVIESCLEFDYTPIESEDIIITPDPEEPEEPEEPIEGLLPEALRTSLSPTSKGDVYNPEADYGYDHQLRILLQDYAEPDSYGNYLGEYLGEYQVSINGILVADQDGIYDEDLSNLGILTVNNIEEYGVSISVLPYVKTNDESGHYVTGDVVVEVSSSAYSTQIESSISGGTTNVEKLPSNEFNKNVMFRITEDNADSFNITDELPPNITDLSKAFAYSTYNKDLNWDVSNVDYFNETFADGDFNGTPFSGSSFMSAISVYGMFRNNESFNKPLEWSDFEPEYTDEMFDGANSFNQNINHLFDSSTWTLQDFDKFFSQQMNSFNQDLSSWSTASTPDVYDYNSDEARLVIGLDYSMPNWTAPKMVFGTLRVLITDSGGNVTHEEILTESFTPDYE